MKLSRVERLILSNQYSILAALYPNEAKSYTEMREIVESGYEFHYSEIAQHILDNDDVMSEDECLEVLDILTMFSAIKRSFNSLEDKPSVQEHDIRFRGFDGNNETKYMLYAQFFCDSQGGRFEDLDRGDNFNSHLPSLDMYRRQLVEWNRSKDKHKLTKEEIERIVAEAVHPENRS
jgi:uncharacterized protein YfbU (UPF0304 family)